MKIMYSILKSVLIGLILFFLLNPLSAQSPEGSWNGVLKVMGQEIRLVFHFEKVGENWKVTMDSPDQGVRGIVIDDVSIIEDDLELKIHSAGISYSGKVRDQEIEGIFRQSGLELPLKLEKMLKGAEILEKEKETLVRPQDPKAPFPYSEEIIQFYNPKAGISLEGNLTIPKGEGPFPAVVLVTGSGPQDRNSEILGHRPFLVIADHLSRNGIAVFRYDERGVGASEGDFSKATTADFADDAKSAIEMLNEHPSINSDMTGIAGHSEGGLVAPLVAINSDAVDFLILMAGSGVSGDQLLLEQKKQIELKMGFDSSMVMESLAYFGNAYQLIVEGKLEGTELKEAVGEALRPVLGPNVPEAQFEALISQLLNPWMVFFMRHDPASVLKQVQCPVLAFNGDLDLQVSAEINLPAIEKALLEGANDRINIHLFEGLYHLFQTATTGLPAEYESIDETIAPEVMELMVKWIKQL